MVPKRDDSINSKGNIETRGARQDLGFILNFSTFHKLIFVLLNQSISIVLNQVASNPNCYQIVQYYIFFLEKVARKYLHSEQRKPDALR